jgi:dTDP-4-dehydrorhamnose 3,5-epimerase
MKFTATDLAGVMIVDIEPLEDERGFFARSFCAEEFAAQGLTAGFVQTNIAFNQTRGTLRGLHYQAAPKPEPKLVRCTRGAIFDVAVDLRPGSPTHGRWTGHELSADNRRALYVPEGCAHGLLTLEDDSEVCYLMGAAYDGALSRGVRWNDPAFAIDWPAAPLVISPRDAGFPDYAP